MCEKPCRSNQNFIACDSCDVWFHVKCMSMPLEVFQGIHNTSWICYNCGLPNFATTLFETFLTDFLPTQNTYSQLSDGDSHQDSLSSPHPSCTLSESFSSLDSSIGIPQHTSSPNKLSQRASVKPRQNTLRVLTVNFQSMKTKKTSFWLLLTETNPDSVIGCETWLHSGIYEREVLPENYHIVARKDRSSDHHGGVLIAAKDTLIGTHLDIQTNTEFAAASFTCQGHAPLIIGSIYRPPNRHFSVAPYITICPSMETYFGLYLRGAMSAVTGIYHFRLLLNIIIFALRSFLP